MSVGLNHPISSSFHIKDGQLDHNWISRFYNTQLAPGKLATFFELWGGQLEDSLYLIRGQPPGPMGNMNFQVSNLCHHRCLSTGDFISPLCQNV